MDNYEIDLKYLKTTLSLPSQVRTGMVIPASKETYFNTKWNRRQNLCPYDMLFHPPDFNSKALRSDRQDPKIIRQNIWDQEYHKGIASTNHLMYLRPKWKVLDRVSKEHVKCVVKSDNPHTRIYNVLEWVVLISDQKSTCD